MNLTVCTRNRFARLTSLLALTVASDRHISTHRPHRAPVVPSWAQPGSPDPHPGRPACGLSPPHPNLRHPHRNLCGPVRHRRRLVPGSARYDAATGQYTINSAGYNIWYTRDEFRYLWKKISGDVSLAADITFPDPNGFGDRKAVLVFRQNLDDDSKEVMVGLHGAGMIHLAQRPEKPPRERSWSTDRRSRPPAAPAPQPRPRHAKRIGIEKHGDSFTIFLSLEGGPMHQSGPPITLPLRRSLLRRHRLLLPPARHLRYSRPFQRRTCKLRGQSPLSPQIPLAVTVFRTPTSSSCERLLKLLPCRSTTFQRERTYAGKSRSQTLHPRH